MVGFSATDNGGWAAGPGGAPAWGRFGAAGLYLRAWHAGVPVVLLQHRAKWTHQGGTWGIPGGAREPQESAVDAAVRECYEECGIAAHDIEILTEVVTSPPTGEREVALARERGFGDLPGGWSYTTVIARTRSGVQLATRSNEESAELSWIPEAQLTQRTLLPAFAAALPVIAQTIAHELG